MIERDMASKVCVMTTRRIRYARLCANIRAILSAPTAPGRLLLFRHGVLGAADVGVAVSEVVGYTGCPS